MTLTLAAVHDGQELAPLAVDVSATTVVLGAIASRDWRPMHHDKDFAVHRNGVRDIFMNTPTQAAWFERYVTDWTGPRGRLGRMKFRMRDSVFPGDTMTISGVVQRAWTGDDGTGWVDLDLRLTADGRLATECWARVAVPADEDDNPWRRQGDQWQP
jgi:hydroxyacyl-ACP dehydratase HTD2-like protein with hotdog domain